MRCANRLFARRVCFCTFRLRTTRVQLLSVWRKCVKISTVWQIGSVRSVLGYQAFSSHSSHHVKLHHYTQQRATMPILFLMQRPSTTTPSCNTHSQHTLQFQFLPLQLHFHHRSRPSYCWNTIRLQPRITFKLPECSGWSKIPSEEQDSRFWCCSFIL